MTCPICAAPYTGCPHRDEHVAAFLAGHEVEGKRLRCPAGHETAVKRLEGLRYFCGLCGRRWEVAA